MASRRTVRFNPTVRTRIIEPKESEYKPLEGDTVYARWITDGVFYKDIIMTPNDDCSYLLNFPYYRASQKEDSCTRRWLRFQSTK